MRTLFGDGPDGVLVHLHTIGRYHEAALRMCI